MNILIVSPRYWPENFRVTDIAESLVKFGHKVTVLTGLPNYPQGYIFDSYKHGGNRLQNHNGVTIIRAKEIGRKNNVLFRFLNYWSFPHYANKIANKLSNNFDIVLVNGLSPIMSAKPGLKYAKKHNKKVIMYEMDLWPESLLAGGITNKSLIYKHYRKVSSKIYSKCDKILVSTKEHIDYIKALPRCGSLQIDYLPQYADTLFEESQYINIDNGSIDLMFAGNIGKAQSVDTIIKTAALLKDDECFKFHIVGSGSELDNIKALTNNLHIKNVFFYGNKSVNEMPKIYSIADIMLVTLENKEYANMTIPGKVQSYMAAGKPIISAADGSTNKLIDESGCGFSVPSCDYVSLYNTCLRLKGMDLCKLGLIGKKYYFAHFSKKVFFDTLLKELIALAKISNKKNI